MIASSKSRLKGAVIHVSPYTTAENNIKLPFFEMKLSHSNLPCCTQIFCCCHSSCMLCRPLRDFLEIVPYCAHAMPRLLPRKRFVLPFENLQVFIMLSERALGMATQPRASRYDDDKNMKSALITLISCPSKAKSKSPHKTRP